MIFAVAGSGKTTFIVESLVKEKRSLIVTYTNSNYDNLSQKILKKFNGVWPETITLMTYFQFLYSPFTDKVICGDCGGYYGHRGWHSNEPCRKHIWRCGDKYHHGTKCSTPKFEDHEMEKAFLMVANRLLAEKNNYIAKYQERFSPLIASTTELEAKLKALQTEYNEIIAEADQLLQANAAKGQDQEETRKHFDAMDVRIKAKKAEIEGIRTKIADTKARKKNIRIFLEALKGTSSLLYRFDTALWHRLVDYVTVTPEKTFVFHLRSGREMIIPLEEVH